MNTQPQCPNCHSYKLSNIAVAPAAGFLLLGIVLVFVVPLLGLGIIIGSTIYGISLRFKTPRYQCRACGLATHI